MNEQEQIMWSQDVLRKLTSIQTKISGAKEAISNGRLEQSRSSLTSVRNDLEKLMEFLDER